MASHASSYHQPSHQLLEGDVHLERSPYVKRPMNAYMLWAQEQRRDVRMCRTVYTKLDLSLQGVIERSPTMSKELGAKWNTLSEAQRRPYVDHAEALKAEHRTSHPQYKYSPKRSRSKLVRMGMPLGHKRPVPPVFACDIDTDELHITPVSVQQEFSKNMLPADMLDSAWEFPDDHISALDKLLSSDEPWPFQPLSPLNLSAYDAQ